VKFYISALVGVIIKVRYIYIYIYTYIIYIMSVKLLETFLPYEMFEVVSLVM